MFKKNVNVDESFGNFSPEDRIRQLLAHGVNPEVARSTSETLDFARANGPNVNPQQLGEFLKSRGHRVTYNQ
jgi:hypothetical protein